MQYTPYDIFDYIKDNNYDSDFMLAIFNHRNGYSIGEITDSKYVKKAKGWYIHSDSYHLNIQIMDSDVIQALDEELYISTFISRFQDDYNVHFLVHKYPKKLKANYDELILQEVVRYMIMMTIVKLHLNTPQKVEDYLGK